MPFLSLSLFGPPRMTRADGSVVSFRLRKELAALAYLVVKGPAPQPRDQLLGLLWPEAPEEAARNNLRVVLTNLRRILGSNALIADRQSVQLTHDAVTLDVATFQAVLATSSAHHRSGSALCATCGAQLKHALELYTGEFLHGFALSDAAPFEEWVSVQREALHQQALDSLSALAEYHEQAGEYAALCHYARRQLELEPWHEPAQRQLMRGLALTGDHAGALAQYELCRQVLAEELRIEPDVETRTLYEQIRAGHLSPHIRAVTAPRHNLPASLTPFIGREAERAALSALCDQGGTRLVTLVGVGGMGKTRLALEVARASVDRYTDGVFFVALAPLHDATALPTAIAHATNLTIRGSDPTAALLRFLHDKHMLIVLDNVEHLLDGVEHVVEILKAAPYVQILATSRERLNIRGEQLFVVEGLSYAHDDASLDLSAAPALRLFEQSARRVSLPFQISQQNQPEILRICQLVGGMPLGIELAAAWSDMLSLGEISEAIAHSASFLEARWRDVPERQRSIRAVFEWSWRLLNDGEQQLLRRLAVFRGSFTREAAEIVVEASLSLLTSLVHKSLVRRSDTGPTHAVRYEIHELVRQFADEHLVAHPADHAAVAERHSSFYLTFLAQRERRLSRHEPREAAAEIHAEIDNIRQAWRWAARQRRFDDLNRSAGGLWQFTLLTGLASERERAFGMVVEQIHAAQQLVHDDTSTSSDGRRLESTFLALYASGLMSRGKYDQAASVAAQAVERGRASADTQGEVIGLFVWGQALFWQGQLPHARARMQDALQVIEGWRTHSGLTEAVRSVEWNIHIWLRAVFVSLGEYDIACSHGTQALLISHGLESRFGEVRSLCNLADIAREIRDLSAARHQYEQALRLIPVVGDRWVEAVVQFELGDVVRLQGDYGLAFERIEQGLAVARELGFGPEEALATVCLGRLCVYVGDYTRAREARDRALRMADTLDAPELRVEGLLLQTLLCQQTGNWEGALASADQTSRLASAFSRRYTQAHALVLLGHAQAALGRDAAKASYHQALAIYTALGNRALACEAQAGLAAFAFAKDARAEALAFVEPIMSVIASDPQVGLDEPFFVYQVCYRVLNDADDPRATTVLHAAQQMLQKYASHIADITLHQSFLATHQEVLPVGVKTQDAC